MKNEKNFITQRYQLAMDRIREIGNETVIQAPFLDYFQKISNFLLEMGSLKEQLEVRRTQDGFVCKARTMEELQKENRALYEDILPENYKNSYGNPVFSVATMGEEYGRILSFLYCELRSLIVSAFEGEDYFFVVRLELFLEIYHSFYFSYEEEMKEPPYEDIRQIVYWFFSDYAEEEIENRIIQQIQPQGDFATHIIMNGNLDNPEYLFEFGEYITANEIETSKYIAALPQETVRKMADTYTEGYRKGFILGNKDITRKKVVNIRYTLGFERVVKQAIENFGAMNLKPTIYRSPVSAFHKNGMSKIGYYGANPNKQYDFDHKEDKALFFDKLYMNRRLEVLKKVYEKNKEQAALFGGPAVIEVFGEEPFEPQNKKEACELSDIQQKLSVEYAIKSGDLVNKYIKGEERSFTIIAFPVPAIGENFQEIFDEVIRINTLDADLYGQIQDTIIQTLDKAEHVEIKGMGENRTNLVVALRKLEHPEKETIFENCVADVNIPVGEVFTSPKLEGTTGILHVTEVFLNELKYENLTISFTDGMITDYTCTNFKKEDENRKYIKDNVLFHHESIPMGEFAIGTNTTAYMVTKKFNMADKMPILIAEKMGPHFAVGDTCYSHSEDVAVFNPNGKEIVARDNSVSILRKKDSKKAYFNCHTDITIPYDELGELTAVTVEGERIPIIIRGRFVLDGCQKLNEAFNE